MAMNSAEVAEFVITRWRCEASVQAIMMQLICLGNPITKDKILAAIKIYVDMNTENLAPKSDRDGWSCESA